MAKKPIEPEVALHIAETTRTFRELMHEAGAEAGLAEKGAEILALVAEDVAQAGEEVRAGLSAPARPPRSAPAVGAPEPVDPDQDATFDDYELAIAGDDAALARLCQSEAARGATPEEIAATAAAVREARLDPMPPE